MDCQYLACSWEHCFVGNCLNSWLRVTHEHRSPTNNDDSTVRTLLLLLLVRLCITCFLCLLGLTFEFVLSLLDYHFLDYQWLDLDLDGSLHEDCKGEYTIVSNHRNAIIIIKTLTLILQR